MITVFKSPSFTDLLHLLCVLQEHCFPECCVIFPKFVWYLNTKSEIQNNDLMFFWILRVRPYKNISRVRIAMDKARNKNLLCESLDNISDDRSLVKIVFPQCFLVCYFYSVNPLRYHDTLSCEFVDNLRDMELIAFYRIMKNLLKRLKFSSPFLAFSA